MTQTLTPFISLAAVIAVIVLARYGRMRIGLAVIVLLGFWLRFNAADQPYLNRWDERYHALVAKNMMQHPFKPMLYRETPMPYNYRSWSSNHIWVHKPPLTLWMLAVSMKLFGVSELGMRLITVLLSSLAAIFTYLICAYHFGKKTALFAAFLYAVNGHLIGLAAGRVPTDHVDSLMIFMVSAGVVASICYIRKPGWITLLVISFITGLAVLTKSLTGYVIPGVLLIYMISHKNSIKNILIRLPVCIVISTIIWLPWNIYINHRFPEEAAWEWTYNFMHVTKALEGHTGTFLYHFERMGRVFGPLVYPALIYALLLLFIKRRRRDLPLWACLVAVYGFFAIARTKMPCYVMIAAPAVLVLYAGIWRDIVPRINKNRLTAGAAAIIALLVVLFPFRNIIGGKESFGMCSVHLLDYFGTELIDEHDKPVSPSSLIPSISTDFEKEITKSRLKAAQTGRDLAARLEKMNWDPQKTVIFNVREPVDAMFYTGATVYHHSVADRELEQVLSAGYRVILYKYRPHRLQRCSSMLKLHPETVIPVD